MGLRVPRAFDPGGAAWESAPAPPPLSRRESPAREALDRPRLAARPGPGAGASLARDRKTVPATGARGGLVAALGRATQGSLQRRWPRARLAE